MGLFGFTKNHLWFAFPMLGFCIGHYLDVKESERMILFRDSSALYGRTLKDGEEPSWP